MSKYKEIANQIEKEIVSQKYTEKLPEQVELAAIFKTSRITIMHALKILADKGLIKTVKGHGTFVNKDAIAQNFLNSGVTQDDGLTHHLFGGAVLTSNVISFNLRYPTQEEAKKLRITVKDQVYDIIRQRIIDGQPAKLEYTIMPVDLIPGITREVLYHSIYSYIRQELGLKIGKDDRVITADKADAYDQTYLKCAKTDPVLCVHQVAYLSDGTPFEISEVRNRYDRGALIVHGSKG